MYWCHMIFLNCEILNPISIYYGIFGTWVQYFAVKNWTPHEMLNQGFKIPYYCCKILTPTPSDLFIPNKEAVHDFTAFLFLHDNYSFKNLILLPSAIGPHDAFVIGLAAITSQVRFKVSPSSMMEFPKITSSGATEKTKLCTFPFSHFSLDKCFLKWIQWLSEDCLL